MKKHFMKIQQKKKKKKSCDTVDKSNPSKG